MMEAEIVPESGYDFRALTVRPLPRNISFKIFSSFFYNFKAFTRALKIIRNFKADIIIGTGGFVAGPVVLAGALLRKKTLIHEQNAYPGITNKILARFVDKICLNFAEAEKHLKINSNQKISITGNPVRKKIINVDQKLAYQELELANNLKTILITGGSLGAEIINNNLIKVYKYALENKLQLVHLTGKKNYNQVIEKLKENNIDFENPLIKVISYLNEMEYALAAADLIIARAGATGLAEITSCGIASILIPFAASAENHQLYNAKTLADNNAALIIEEKELNQDLLLEKVKEIIEDDEKRISMGQSAESMTQKNSLQNIIDIIENELI